MSGRDRFNGMAKGMGLLPALSVFVLAYKLNCFAAAIHNINARKNHGILEIAKAIQQLIDFLGHVHWTTCDSLSQRPYLSLNGLRIQINLNCRSSTSFPTTCMIIFQPSEYDTSFIQNLEIRSKHNHSMKTA